jgi:hypothetical protein
MRGAPQSTFSMLMRLKHHQLTSKRGILGLESADWPERRTNSLKGEEEQRD